MHIPFFDYVIWFFLVIHLPIFVGGKSTSRLHVGLVCRRLSRSGRRQTGHLRQPTPVHHAECGGPGMKNPWDSTSRTNDGFTMKKWFFLMVNDVFFGFTIEKCFFLMVNDVFFFNGFSMIKIGNMMINHD